LDNNLSVGVQEWLSFIIKRYYNRSYRWDNNCISWLQRTWQQSNCDFS